MPVLYPTVDRLPTDVLIADRRPDPPLALRPTEWCTNCRRLVYATRNGRCPDCDPGPGGGLDTVFGRCAGCRRDRLLLTETMRCAECDRSGQI